MLLALNFGHNTNRWHTDRRQPRMKSPALRKVRRKVAVRVRSCRMAKVREYIYYMHTQQGIRSRDPMVETKINE